MIDENSAENYKRRFYDPVYVVNFLHHAMDRQDAETGGALRLLPLVGLLRVEDVQYTVRWSKSFLSLRVRAVRGDGFDDTLIYEHEETAPDYSTPDPGNFEYSVVWENIDDDGRPITWTHFWTAVRTVRGIAEAPVRPAEAEARTRKMNALYQTLRKTVRCRIEHGAELHINAAQRDRAYQQLGLALVGVKEHDPIWTILGKQT